MLETEVKILEIDRAQVVARLTQLGAELTFDDEIEALYFDTPDRKLRGQGITLRLRREGPRAILALKRDRAAAGAKVREEHEVTVSDFDNMKTMLEALGYTVWLAMKKHRSSYALDGLHFELDRYHDAYSFIPEFLEIEGPSIDVIRRYAGSLGFSEEDCRPWDAMEVAAYYSARNRPPA